MSVLKIGLDLVIADFVKLALPAFSPKDKLLWVPVEIDIQHAEKDIAIRKNAHFLFHRDSNYVKVFMSVDTPEFRFSPSLKNIPRDMWICKCNHDSCWRTDGVGTPLHKLHMGAYEGIEIASSDEGVSEYISMGITGPKLITGKVKRNSEVSEEYEEKAFFVDILKDKYEQ